MNKKAHEFVEVKREKLLEEAGRLASGEYHLSTITAVDNGEHLEVLYFFAVPEKNVTLKVKVDSRDAKVPTITPVIPSALLYEREIFEMFGIEIEGHPRPRNTFIADSYKGEPPLLKRVKF
ncbi:MAG: NADH-quinone oxidoreductase subunit C [Candidatus Micrarchaeota archaeon]|nr:NADH-quinone oxidoreductase subunit C [Candidatus Micrarchaeota archaeon]